MSGPGRREGSGETYPTICPRCYAEGELGFAERLSIAQVYLKADGTLERKRAREEGLELGLVCPKCHEKYWMRLEFAAGKPPSISVSTAPHHATPEGAKAVKPFEVFYSKEKRWWFSRRGGKVIEVGPGESPR